MPVNLGPRDVVPLQPQSKYAVALSWDQHGPAVDLDLQAVVVDKRGSIIDAVYYNNMKAQRCITHSGDERTGERQGFDEVIWVGTGKMPEDVKMLVFVIAAHSGGHLRDVQNGVIHLLQDKNDNEVGRIPVERSTAEVDVVATMVRDDRGAWSFNVVDEPAEQGRHFMDVLEPTMGNIIRKVIPSAPRRMKVAFAMEKGGVVDLPETASIQSVTAGLGWDVLGDGVDLDVSAVLFSAEGRLVDAVFFGNLESRGLRHSGDNLTGAGSGDDEQIHCDLQNIPSQVHQVFITVHIYTQRVTFDRVRNAYCRIFDTSGTEFARYELKEGGSQSGLIMARMFREPGGHRWGFQALGKLSRGSMYKDSVPDMMAICKQPARAFQLRGQSTMQFSGEGPADPAVSVRRPPPEPNECCALQ